MEAPKDTQDPWFGEADNSIDGFVCLPIYVRARLMEQTIEGMQPGEVAFVNHDSVVIDAGAQGAMMVDAHDAIPKRTAMDKFDPRHNPGILRVFNKYVDGYLVDFRYITETKMLHRLTGGTKDNAVYKAAVDKHGAEPALGFIVLDDEGKPQMSFLDGADYTEEAEFLMQEVDRMIPEIQKKQRMSRLSKEEQELVAAAANLLRFTKKMAKKLPNIGMLLHFTR